MKRLAPLLALMLSACATQAVKTYVPFVPRLEMHDAKRFGLDLRDCRSYALEYLSGKSDLDPVAVASASAQGALSNLASAAINPLATGLSGVGGGSSEAATELGLNSMAAKHIVALCMSKRGDQSHAYIILAPEL